jgi:hypothetical protein
MTLLIRFHAGVDLLERFSKLVEEQPPVGRWLHPWTIRGRGHTGIECYQVIDALRRLEGIRLSLIRE